MTPFQFHIITNVLLFVGCRCYHRSPNIWKRLFQFNNSRVKLTILSIIFALNSNNQQPTRYNNALATRVCRHMDGAVDRSPKWDRVALNYDIPGAVNNSFRHTRSDFPLWPPISQSVSQSNIASIALSLSWPNRIESNTADSEWIGRQREDRWPVQNIQGTRILFENWWNDRDSKMEVGLT